MNQTHMIGMIVMLIVTVGVNPVTPVDLSVLDTSRNTSG